AEAPRGLAARPNRLEVFTDEFGIPSGSAPDGGDYNVKVSLNSAKLKSLGDGPMAYTVTVFAKNLTSTPIAKQHLVIGESRGVIAPAGDLEFDLEGAKLTQGAYRLRATANFRALGDAQGAEAQAGHGFTTFVEGGVLQIY